MATSWSRPLDARRGGPAQIPLRPSIRPAAILSFFRLLGGTRAASCLTGVEGAQVGRASEAPDVESGSVKPKGGGTDDDNAGTT